MGKKKGGKKSKIEGAQRSRSASKCEDSTNQPIVIENQENAPSKQEQTVETSPVTLAEKIKTQLSIESNDRCGSPSNSSALELLAEIDKDNKQEKLQHQSSIKNATEMINEIDQELDVLSMEAITMDSKDEETEPKKTISEENQKKDDVIAPLQQSTTIQCLTKEVTDAKSDETSDQPEEEYGFMEALKLDSDDDDEVENVPKTVNDVVPNRQKTPEDYAQNEDDVLNMESITMDSEDKDEVKIEVKEDKTPQAPKTTPVQADMNDKKIIESEKKSAEEVLDILDMKGMTFDSDNEDEVKTIQQKIETKDEKTDATLNGEIEIPTPVQNGAIADVNDTKILKLEKKSEEEVLDVLDMEGMTLDSDNEDEVATIQQKLEPKDEKTDATLNGEIEILSQEENLNEKQGQNGGEKVSGTSSLTIQLKRTKSGAKIQDTYFIKRQNGMYDQVKDKNLVIVNAQALAQICQEYDIKVEKFFEAPSSQIEVSNSTVSQIKKAELKLSGKMSH